WDGIIAGILEGINLIKTAMNSLIGAVNLGKKYIPFADKTPLEQMQTQEVGSIFAEMAASRRERASNLYSDPFQGDLKTQNREISKDYAEIVKGLSESTKLTKEQKRIQDQLADAVKKSRTEQEQLHFAIAEMERLRPFAKTAEQVKAIETNIANARKELDKLRVEAELKSPTAKAFASLASEIDDGFKDAFKSAFSESDGGFKKLIDGWKNTFKDFLAELAYQAAARPIMVSIVGAVGGVMGLSSGAIGSVLGNVTGAPNILGGGTGGGMGLSGLSSIGSGLLNGGLYSS